MSLVLHQKLGKGGGEEEGERGWKGGGDGWGRGEGGGWGEREGRGEATCRLSHLWCSSSCITQWEATFSCLLLLFLFDGHDIKLQTHSLTPELQLSVVSVSHCPLLLSPVCFSSTPKLWREWMRLGPIYKPLFLWMKQNVCEWIGSLWLD